MVEEYQYIQSMLDVDHEGVVEVLVELRERISEEQGNRESEFYRREQELQDKLFEAMQKVRAYEGQQAAATVES